MRRKSEIAAWVWVGIVMILAALALCGKAAEAPQSKVVPTYQWSRDVLGSATAALGRSNMLAETKRSVNLWDIAPPNGTNDAATLRTALGLLSPASGGVIETGPGTWAFNNVITQQNVTLRGVSHMVDFTATLTNYWKQATNAIVVLQVGDDARLVKGFKLQDTILDGRSVGSMGLLFSGGAFEWTVEDAVVAYFTNCVKIQGGTTYPASLGYFNRVDGNPITTVDGARGWLILNTSNYPTSYTTEIVLNNCHWNGPGSSPSNAYVMEIDSCEVKMVNTYFDVHGGHGIKISHNLSPSPWLDGINSNCDSGASTNVAVEGYENGRKFAGLATVNFQIFGKYKELDGTLMQPPKTHLRQDSFMVYPTIYGALSFSDPTDPNWLGGTYSNLQIYGGGAGATLYLDSHGMVRNRLGNGLFQLENTDAGSVGDGNVYLRFLDSISAKTADIHSLGGFLDIRAASGSGTRLQKFDGSVTGLQVNGVDGAVFLLGPGLNASSTPYLDSNKQIKSAPTGTATLDFPSTAAQTSSELTITATGATVGDCVILGMPATGNANTCFTARVSAADTVTVKFNNYSTGAVDPASGTFKVTVLK